MATFKHPASLNPLQQFGQARSILRKTTRANNPAWYQDALELNFQLHVRPDGPTFSAFYFDRKKQLWTAGPALSEEIFEDPTRLEALIFTALKLTRANGHAALGVILHIAEDFATTELKPEFDNPAALPEIRDAAVSDPASILADASIQADQASWRVLPYPAASSESIGTAITHTRQYAKFFTQLRETSERENFPIISHAQSAPLAAIMGLSESLTHTPGHSFVTILQYPWFTVLAFFNERSDLRLIRTLHHRGIRRATNLRNALTTTSASLEFVDPDIFLVQLGEMVDSSLEVNLRMIHTTSRVETVHLQQAEGLPEWCLEPGIVANSPSIRSGADTSHTLSILREDKWALQNFLPTPPELVAVYPSRMEMRLLKMVTLARVALFTIVALGLTYFALGIFNLMSKPEWSFNLAEANMTKAMLAKLSAERKKSEHWENLLQDRSKAWVAMESLSRMFPENSGVLVKTFSHTSKPDSTPGQAKVGFIKEWKITGFARDEALERLNTLNTNEGIQAQFTEVARLTGNSAYNPTAGNRSISVNVRTQENSGFKLAPPEESGASDGSTYPFTFDLTFTQRFETTDPMALSVPKAP